jgi:hypothetical protein
MMIKKFMSGVLVASLLVLAACAGQKGPATTAMAAAESTLASIKDDAAKYLPEELKGAEGTLASLKNSLEKGDYKAVMAGAPALMSSLDSLKTQVGAKLEEAKVATAEWAGYATDLPKMVEAIQSRVTTLSSAKKLPSGLHSTRRRTTLPACSPPGPMPLPLSPVAMPSMPWPRPRRSRRRARKCSSCWA